MGLFAFNRMRREQAAKAEAAKGEVEETTSDTPDEPIPEQPKQPDPPLLAALGVPELRAIAKELEIPKYNNTRKADLIVAIAEAQAAQEQE